MFQPLPQKYLNTSRVRVHKYKWNTDLESDFCRFKLSSTRVRPIHFDSANVSMSRRSRFMITFTHKTAYTLTVRVILFDFDYIRVIDVSSRLHVSFSTGTFTVWHSRSYWNVCFTQHGRMWKRTRQSVKVFAEKIRRKMLTMGHVIWRDAETQKSRINAQKSTVRWATIKIEKPIKIR